MPKRKPPRGPVPKEAINFLESKGLKPAFSYLDVWKQEHNTAFTVAKIMEKHILADVQTSLVHALADGTPFKQWSKEVRGTLDKSGWTAYGSDRTRPRRLNVIYDTNMRTARAVGQWQRIERTKRVRPFLRYALGPSERHRPHHVSWDGTTLPVEHAFWSDHAPQNGWMCKCHLIQESRTVVERRGGPSRRAPPAPTVAWKNPRTGRTERVPVGIDPGFNFNPGRSRPKIMTAASRDAKVGLDKVEKSGVPGTKVSVASKFRELIMDQRL